MDNKCAKDQMEKKEPKPEIKKSRSNDPDKNRKIWRGMGENARVFEFRK